MLSVNCDLAVFFAISESLWMNTQCWECRGRLVVRVLNAQLKDSGFEPQCAHTEV